MEGGMKHQQTKSHGNEAAKGRFTHGFLIYAHAASSEADSAGLGLGVILGFEIADMHLCLRPWTNAKTTAFILARLYFDPMEDHSRCTWVRQRHN